MILLNNEDFFSLKFAYTDLDEICTHINRNIRRHMQTPDFLLSCLNSPILRNIKTTILLVPIAAIDCCVYAPRTNIN